MKRASWVWSGTEGLRALHRVLGATGALFLVVLVVVLLRVEKPAVPVAIVDRAEMCVLEPTVAAFDRVGIGRLVRSRSEPSASCWKPVALPHTSNVTPGSFDTGMRPIGRVLLRTRYVVPANWNPLDALTVYVPRVNGWGWEVEIDGNAVADNLDDWRMTWNTPVVATILPGRFAAGRTVEVRVEIAYLPDVGFAASRIHIGPATALDGPVSIRRFLQVSMPQGCSAVLLLMGGFFFAFWLSRRTETAHLLVAAAALAWCVCNLQYVMPRHDSALLDGWYSAITAMSVSWVMWFIYLFAFRFDSRRLPWVEWSLPAFVLAMSLVSVPNSGFGAQSDVAINTVNAIVATVVTSVVSWRALRERNVELRIIAVALVVSLAAGIHDVALLAQIADPEDVYLLPLAGVLVFGSFLIAVQRRYAGAIQAHEDLQATLESRLADRERELNANHARVLELERIATLAAERQRLTDDIHDGVGSSLLTVLSTVEKNAAAPADLAPMLRNCLDDLRLVIDSLEPAEHDVAMLLATVRFRLGQRLESAGLALRWEVDTLPRLSWLGASHALHFLRIVQEALANVIKHAHATSIRIAATVAGNEVRVEVADDGVGFRPEEAGRGRGLKSQVRRAGLLNARLEVRSAPGSGTVVRLSLPL